MCSRFSTATVVDSNYLAPWLAAAGPLACSPTEPPARDYFFQHTWILRGIFNPEINPREHRYFGSPQKVSARLLFGLWASARSGAATILPGWRHLGRRSQGADGRVSEQHSGHYLLRSGESEVKIIHQSQISELQGFGCEEQFIPATESEP